METLNETNELSGNYVVERRNDRGLRRVFVADVRGGRSKRGRIRDRRDGKGRASERAIAFERARQNFI